MSLENKKEKAEEEAAKTLVLEGADGLITGFHLGQDAPASWVGFWRNKADYDAGLPAISALTFSSAEALRNYWIGNLNALARIWFEAFGEPIVPQEGAEG